MRLVTSDIKIHIHIEIKYEKDFLITHSLEQDLLKEVNLITQKK